MSKCSWSDLCSGQWFLRWPHQLHQHEQMLYWVLLLHQQHLWILKQETVFHTVLQNSHNSKETSSTHYKKPCLFPFSKILFEFLPAAAPLVPTTWFPASAKWITSAVRWVSHRAAHTHYVSMVTWLGAPGCCSWIAGNFFSKGSTHQRSPRFPLFPSVSW